MTGDCPSDLQVAPTVRHGRNQSFGERVGASGTLLLSPGDTDLALIYQPCAAMNGGSSACRGPNAIKLFPLFFYT